MGGIGKRVFDLVAALGGVVVLGPVFLLIGITIRLESPGPVIFRQARVGRHGRHFEILKFRSMCEGAEGLGRETMGTKDPRITRVGAILRKTKLDELPQLLNVIRGDMSLVGPRPEIPYYADRYTKEDRVILSIRPGITDPSSLVLADLDAIMASRGSESAADFYVRVVQPQKLTLQRSYVESRTFLGDLWVILMTLRRITWK
jgi:lipopolysaccharide/colanic/teichoic acid biosynthesis glycosyltransferase